MLLVGNKKIRIDRPVIKTVQITAKYSNDQYYYDTEGSDIVKNVFVISVLSRFFSQTGPPLFMLLFTP